MIQTKYKNNKDWKGAKLHREWADRQKISDGFPGDSF